MKKCRCDERLQTKTKEFTRLPYTGLVLELEHLKIESKCNLLDDCLFLFSENCLFTKIEATWLGREEQIGRKNAESVQTQQACLQVQ
jgi:hypothetical protein